MSLQLTANPPTSAGHPLQHDSMQTAPPPLAEREVIALENSLKPSRVTLTCSDLFARPETILHYEPGEAIEVKNPGNMVDAETVGKHFSPRPSAVLSAISMAAKQGNLQKICVLGHSGCDTFEYTKADSPVENPGGYLQNWLAAYLPTVAKKERGKKNPDNEARAEANIRVQVKRLERFVSLLGLKRPVEVEGWYVDEDLQAKRV